MQVTNELDSFVYEPPTQQEYQWKVYVNECDSYIGSQLVQQFRNDHLIQANPNIIVGSSTRQSANSSQQLEIPPGVDSIISTANQRLYNSVLLEADIILFTLHKNNIQDFEYILKLLKNATLERQKRIVCVSSFLSWGKGKNTGHVVAKRDELHLRNTLDYHIKFLEDHCLAINHENEKVKGSVVFSGLVYGLGEDSLFGYFKRALGQEKPLEVFGKGTNLIPMIHLSDLCQIVYNVAFKAFEKGKNWHFACDKSKITQRQLIACIAQNLGNGSIVEQPIQECFNKDNFDSMTVDIQVLNAQELPQWHSPNGIKPSISQIVSEFNTYRGLKPNKILITGPPVSGKSTISDMLQKSYGLPVISIKSLIQDIKKDESQFGKQIKTILQEIRTIKVQEQRKAHEEMKKKKKGKGVEEFDAGKVVARLPDQHLKRVVKWRLNQSDCLNKGYILDNVVKTYKLAEGIFVGQNGVVDEKILPNTVFVVKATDQQVKERLKTIPPEKTQNTHWNEQHTTRRLMNYSKQNEDKSLRSFFDNKVDIKDVEINYQDSSIFCKFVERKGPLGFKKQVQQAPKPSQDAVTKQNPDQNVDQQPDDEEQNEDEFERQIEEEFNLEKLTQKEQKILNEKSRPIRQYLIDNVIPEITEGLLQICKEVPQDPIDFLIGFLERKNNKKKK